MLGGLFLWSKIMPFIQVNDIQLFYEKKGQGTPIIFLHGNGEDHNIFKPLIDLLSQDFTCYALDSRNHGQSDMTDQFHYQTMMDDTYAFITQLGLSNINIIGFSDGSIITMLLAMQYPKLIHKMILLGPNLTPNDFNDACTRYLQRLYRKNPDPLYKMMLKEPQINEKSLNIIKSDTLIIGGENDLYKEGTFERIKKNIYKSNIYIIKNHDHSSYIANNAMLYEKINLFFK